MRFAWELGLSNNLNGFFDRIQPRRCTKDIATCLEEYSDYVNDPETKAIVLVGEIGGGHEEEAAEYI